MKNDKGALSPLIRLADHRRPVRMTMADGLSVAERSVTLNYEGVAVNTASGGLLLRALPRSDTPAWLRTWLGALAIMVFAHFLHSVTDLGGESIDDLFDNWLYCTVMAGCASACLARGVVIPSARLAWIVLGLGLTCDTVAEIMSSISEALAPNVQRGLYLCFYLSAYIAIVLLGRRRIAHPRISVWLDGLSGLLAVGALSAATLFTPVLAATHWGTTEAAFNLAYPLTDLLLIGVTVGMLASTGWNMARSYALIALGFVIMTVADGLFIYRAAVGGYAAGTPLDTLWLLAVLMLAFAAWQPDGRRVRESHSPGVVMAAPLASGTVAIAVLAYGNIEGAGAPSVWLAVATLVTVLLRLAATFTENIRLISSITALANRDALTNLGNRRALFEDLEDAVAEAHSRPKLLLLFDLNGFKRYNDTFGHPAGDALLRCLAAKLREQTSARGRAYRLGGDEFCALLDVGEDDPAELAVELAVALPESGERFGIGACYGVALLGREALTADEALHIADRRLYEQKALLRQPTHSEWRDVRLGVLLRERDRALAAPPADLSSLELTTMPRAA